jgi:hypothetical protein
VSRTVHVQTPEEARARATAAATEDAAAPNAPRHEPFEPAELEPLFSPAELEAFEAQWLTEPGTGQEVPRRALQPPARRHRADDVTQRSLAKEKNTVIEPGVDVAGDVAAINRGSATRVNGNYSINGRVYGEHKGTLYPLFGPGFHTLSRAAYKALGVYNAFGITPHAERILDRMRTSQTDRLSARRVWSIFHP